MKRFKKEILENPELGEKILGENVRKIRMAIASKNRGKSGGARIITCTMLVDVENAKIYLLTIYDKSEQDDLPDYKVKELIEKYGLMIIVEGR